MLEAAVLVLEGLNSSLIESQRARHYEQLFV